MEPERFAAHLEARRHRAGRQYQFLGRALENARGHGVAGIADPLDQRSECGDGHARLRPVVDDARQSRDVGDLEFVEERGRQVGPGPAPVGGPHHRRQRLAPDPVATSLVADHVSPATRARRFAECVPAVHDRPCPRDDDDTGGVTGGGYERDQSIVDDDGP